MSALSVNPPFPIFTDTDGQPLENGYIWIGTANLDPQGNPINVYWDSALTQVAGQPIRTINGYPSRNGSPSRLFVNSEYSIRVQNKNGTTVASVNNNSEALGDISSALVTFIQSGTGAVSRSVQSKLRDTVSVKDFGAVGDGVTDDTAAIQAAINASSYVLFPDGYDFVCNDVQMPNRATTVLEILGSTKVRGSTGTYIFEQRNRSKFVNIKGGDFRGPIPAFRYSAQEGVLPFGTSAFEFLIENSRFEMGANVYAVSLFGAREGRFSNCLFEGNATIGGWGVYMERAINTEFIGCFFRGLEFALVHDKSEGLKVIGGTAIGCSQTLRAIDSIGIQLTQVMWDYNDYGALLYGCGAVMIGGESYISGRTANPVIWVRSSATVGIGQASRKVRISDCSIVQNLSTPSSICIKVSDTNNIDICNNTIVGYMGNGVEYTGSTTTFIRVADNIFDADASATGSDIRWLTSECNSATITGNTMDRGFVFDTAINRKISKNIGLLTENRGSATILSGTTSIAVTHGLATTPPIDGISVTPHQPLGAANAWFVSATGPTTFTISVNTNPGANVEFGWSAQITNR